jgi:hypothetical protein
VKDASFTQGVASATCDDPETLTYSGQNVAFEGASSPVSGPLGPFEVTATPAGGHEWTDGGDEVRTVFSGSLADKLPADDPSCDDDDEEPPACEETVKGCDEPPVVLPDDGVTPPKSPSNHPTSNHPTSNHPGNGPTVKGVQGPTTVAGTPAARVPTAVDAGLSAPEREPAGTAGALALLGLATALLGAAMVGASFRPRRRRNLAG